MHPICATMKWLNLVKRPQRNRVGSVVFTLLCSLGSVWAQEASLIPDATNFYATEERENLGPGKGPCRAS